MVELKPGSREAVLLDHLIDQARSGRACPDMAGIATYMGWASSDTAKRYLNRLQRLGRIAIDVFGGKRRVTILGVLAADGRPLRTADVGIAAARERRAEINRTQPRARWTAAERLSTVCPPVSGRIAWSPCDWRPRTCQWIHGEPSAQADRCGAKVVAGSSYCAEHHARCYETKGKGADTWLSRLA